MNVPYKKGREGKVGHVYQFRLPVGSNRSVGGPGLGEGVDGGSQVVVLIVVTLESKYVYPG